MSRGTLFLVLTIGEVTNAIVVLGLSLTPEGELKPELTARLDKAVERYEPNITSIIVCGSHSFIEPEMVKFNEADKMEAYIRQNYGRSIDILKEGRSDSIQNNLLMVRKDAQKLQGLQVVSANEVRRRVDQCVEWFYPRIKSYTFVGCPEPNTSTEAREKKLFDDFNCIVTWYAEMQKGDRHAYRQLLNPEGMSRWAQYRQEHHEECPSALGIGDHWSKFHPRPTR